MKFFAVIDTNIIVSALLRKNSVPDAKDVPFYSVVIASRNERESFLVTGNIKHFPKKYFIVTPRQMLDKIEGIA